VKKGEPEKGKGYCPEDKTATEYNFFLQMLHVFAIQIAPADGKLLLLVDHIMG